MNDGNTVEISKHMYGSDRKRHNKCDDIERLPESGVSLDLGKSQCCSRLGNLSNGLFCVS